MSKDELKTPSEIASEFADSYLLLSPENRRQALIELQSCLVALHKYWDQKPEKSEVFPDFKNCRSPQSLKKLVDKVLSIQGYPQ